MRRVPLILLLLLVCVSLTGGLAKRRGVVAVVAPSGGAGTGVEARYATITAESGIVIACSEPMDGPNGAFFSNSPYGSPDSALSPDASECWGRGGNWQVAAYQDPPTPPQGQTIVPVTGWGTVGYASEQTVGRGDWWLGYKLSSLASDFGLTSATICARFYKQVSSNYQATSANCGGSTTRNKIHDVDNFRANGVLGCTVPTGCTDQWQFQRVVRRREHSRRD
jgi:hypothetical protein